jgi:hypothetical protein
MQVIFLHIIGSDSFCGSVSLGNKQILHPLFMVFVTQVVWGEPLLQTVSIRIGFLHRKKFQTGKAMDSGWCLGPSHFIRDFAIGQIA